MWGYYYQWLYFELETQCAHGVFPTRPAKGTWTDPPAPSLSCQTDNVGLDSRLEMQVFGLTP